MCYRANDLPVFSCLARLVQWAAALRGSGAGRQGRGSGEPGPLVQASGCVQRGVRRREGKGEVGLLESDDTLQISRFVPYDRFSHLVWEICRVLDVARETVDARPADPFGLWPTRAAVCFLLMCSLCRGTFEKDSPHTLSRSRRLVGICGVGFLAMCCMGRCNPVDDGWGLGFGDDHVDKSEVHGCRALALLLLGMFAFVTST